MREQITNDDGLEIVNQYNNDVSCKQIEKNFNGKYSYSMIILYLQKIGVYKNNKLDALFSEEDKEKLRKLYINSEWDAIYNEFPIFKNKQKIYTVCSQLGIKKESYFWSKEDTDYLKENYGLISLDDFVKYYDGRHTYKAINQKAKKLNLVKSRTWTKEEDEILINNYSNVPTDEMLKLLPNRTYNSIIDRGKLFGIKSYQYLNEKYSEEQKQFIIDNWKSMSDEQIANVLGKTACGIRDQRAKLNLYKINREYAKYENLAKLFRGHIQDWKTATMQSCDYKCVLTGSKDFSIHHLYSFNQILCEAFDIVKEEIELVSDNPEDYTKAQLDRMIEIFRNVHEKYPLGVCVRKDIHDLFHRIYGSGGNTPEQWNRFVDDYKNGKITI